jgi:hypothetical protein
MNVWQCVSLAYMSQEIKRISNLLKTTSQIKNRLNFSSLRQAFSEYSRIAVGLHPGLTPLFRFVTKFYFTHGLVSIKNKLREIVEQMNLDEGLKINAPQVVHETIDGETILLNLDSGTYYSLNDMGAVLWAFIENNYTKREILKDVLCHFQIAAEKVEASINNFLNELIEEGLVVPIQIGVHKRSPNHSATILSSLRGKTTDFIKPVLSKYTDMQDLLLLDPIHDVDDSGWPSIKAN